MVSGNSASYAPSWQQSVHSEVAPAPVSGNFGTSQEFAWLLPVHDRSPRFQVDLMPDMNAVITGLLLIMIGVAPNRSQYRTNAAPPSSFH